MRRSTILVVLVGLLAIVPVALAATKTDATYKGTTSQGKKVSFSVAHKGDDRFLPTFKIAYDAPCGTSGFVFHGTATLSQVDVAGGRFIGRKRTEAPGGKNRIAKLLITIKGQIKGGGKASGGWGTRVEITNLKENKTLLRCRTGHVNWSAKRVGKTVQ